VLQDLPEAVCPDGGDSGEGEGALALFKALLGLQPKSHAIRGYVVREKSLRNTFISLYLTHSGNFA